MLDLIGSPKGRISHDAVHMICCQVHSRCNSTLSTIGKNTSQLLLCLFIMPPTLKKLEGHIAFGLSVCVSVCVCVLTFEW